jgi:hypothetical protein
VKLRQFQARLSDSELARFKRWCKAQKPARSMGAQIRYWIEHALSARRGTK